MYQNLSRVSKFLTKFLTLSKIAIFGGRGVYMGPNIKLWEKNPVYSSCNYIHVLKYFNLEYLCHSFVLTLMYYWKLESLLYFGRYKYMYQFYSISHRFLLRLSQYNQVYVQEIIWNCDMAGNLQISGQSVGRCCILYTVSVILNIGNQYYLFTLEQRGC